METSFLHQTGIKRRAKNILWPASFVRLIAVVSLLFIARCSSAFVVSPPSRITNRGGGVERTETPKTTHSSPRAPHRVAVPGSSVLLQMSRGGERDLTTTIVAGFFIVLFVGSSFLPLGMFGDVSKDLSISDSVVTTQDQPEKLANYAAKGLPRYAIEEKLGSIPVFYLVDDGGTMKTDIYLSYKDAKEQSTKAEGGTKVEATTLDQVIYPLILKKGRTKLALPPPPVRKAEHELSDESNTSPKKSYRLVPSTSSLRDSAEFKLELDENDVPLYVADRLAFAGGSRGAQLPLFFEKEDCIASYNRLRGSGGSSNLPETPNIRTTTLRVELDSMERGTRPGLSQLAFYASYDDALKADELMQ